MTDGQVATGSKVLGSISKQRADIAEALAPSRGLPPCSFCRRTLRFDTPSGQCSVMRNRTSVVAGVHRGIWQAAAWCDGTFDDSSILTSECSENVGSFWWKTKQRLIERASA